MLWFRAPQKVYFKKGCMPVALDELGKVHVVNGDACIACGQCELRCPDYAIFVDKGAAV